MAAMAESSVPTAAGSNVSSRAKSGRKGSVAGRLPGAGLLLAAALFLAPAAAHGDSYDSQRSGHPLRVTAYVLHPVGVVADRLIFRPAHWLGSKPGLRTLFGHSERGAPVYRTTKKHATN